MDHTRAMQLKRLAVTYRRIGAEQMCNLPVYNDRLAVETVGFRDWEGRLAGVLVTPWCMNLVLLPGAQDEWSGQVPGSVTEWDFPAGKYPLNTCVVDGIDVHLSMALFSTMKDFPDQVTSCAVAQETIRGMFAKHDTVPSGSAIIAQEGLLSRPMSRRGLLRGLVAVNGKQG